MAETISRTVTGQRLWQLKYLPTLPAGSVPPFYGSRDIYSQNPKQIAIASIALLSAAASPTFAIASNVDHRTVHMAVAGRSGAGPGLKTFLAELPI